MKTLLRFALGAVAGLTLSVVFGAGWTARMVADAEIIRFEREGASRAIQAAHIKASRPTPAACANAAAHAIAAADLEAAR